MATEGNLQTISLIAAADLRTKQFYAVKVDTAGKAALAGAGDMAVGVLQNNPNTGEIATVAYFGISKMVAGGNVTMGDPVASDSAAKAKLAVKGRTDTSNTGAAADALLGSNVMGIALDSAVANDVFRVMLLQMGSVPTTAS